MGQPTRSGTDTVTADTVTADTVAFQVPIDLKQALKKQATTFRWITLAIAVTVGIIAAYISLYWFFIQRTYTQGNTDAYKDVMKITEMIATSNDKCHTINGLKAVLKNLQSMIDATTLYWAPMIASMLETTHALVLDKLRMYYEVHECGVLDMAGLTV